jgi:hypothetical protein
MLLSDTVLTRNALLGMEDDKEFYLQVFTVAVSRINYLQRSMIAR